MPKQTVLEFHQAPHGGIGQQTVDGRDMMRWTQTMILGGLLSLLSCAPAWSAEDTTTLVLSGKLCDLYYGAVEAALKTLPGVRAVERSSKKGSVIVTSEAGKISPDRLTSAVSGVKGDGWACKADVVK